MALLDLRNLPCKFGNLRELAGIGTDSDIGGDGQPERRRIHIHAVATNHPRVLKLARPLGVTAGDDIPTRRASSLIVKRGSP